MTLLFNAQSLTIQQNDETVALQISCCCVLLKEYCSKKKNIKSHQNNCYFNFQLFFIIYKYSKKQSL